MKAGIQLADAISTDSLMLKKSSALLKHLVFTVVRDWKKSF
jgi:hypothetical protein